jgi:hypothetical protein
VVGQQSHLTVRAIQPGHWQVRLPLRGAGDCQRIDGVGLAVGPRGVPNVGHQLGRDPDDGLARGEQIAFQAPRQVPAVLDRPQQPAAVTGLPGHLLSPCQKTQMVFGVRPDRLHGQLPPSLVNGDDGVGALVRVDPQSDHVPVSFAAKGDQGPAGGHIPVRGDATLLSSHAGWSLASGGPH